MSNIQWADAAGRVAGVVSLASRPDALAAAKDALEEILKDWDTRRDWRYTQVVASDIAIVAGDSEFTLPTTFKKPYVAYLNTGKVPLWFIERANWHRVNPGDTSQSVPRWYTVYNEATSGKGQIFPTSGSADTLSLLYYKAIIYRDSDDAFLDIPDRWTGYILDGARYKLSLAKGSAGKAGEYKASWYEGIKKAKEDDLRLPDQFLSFQPPDTLNTPPFWNPNSTWQSTWGW